VHLTVEVHDTIGGTLTEAAAAEDVGGHRYVEQPFGNRPGEAHAEVIVLRLHNEEDRRALGPARQHVRLQEIERVSRERDRSPKQPPKKPAGLDEWRAQEAHRRRTSRIPHGLDCRDGIGEEDRRDRDAFRVVHVPAARRHPQQRLTVRAHVLAESLRHVRQGTGHVTTAEEQSQCAKRAGRDYDIARPDVLRRLA
jgi:hypothetical protein